MWQLCSSKFHYLYTRHKKLQKINTLGSYSKNILSFLLLWEGLVWHFFRKRMVNEHTSRSLQFPPSLPESHSAFWKEISSTSPLRLPSWHTYSMHIYLWLAKEEKKVTFTSRSDASPLFVEILSFSKAESLLHWPLCLFCQAWFCKGFEANGL